jgi:hypothetical protein
MQMLDIDKAWREKGPQRRKKGGEGAQRLDKMWAIISAIGLWVNVEDVSEFISKLR